MSAAGKSAGVLFPGACKAAHHAGNRCSISSRVSWDDLAGAIRFVLPLESEKNMS